jgi:hypothetical protein
VVGSVFGFPFISNVQIFMGDVKIPLPEVECLPADLWCTVEDDGWGEDAVHAVHHDGVQQRSCLWADKN